MFSECALNRNNEKLASLILHRALYVIGKLLGAAQADETAQYMEYERWHGMPVEE